MKSWRRVPTASTKSASAASALAAEVPVTPTAPRASGKVSSIDDLPACVTATGIAVRLGERRQLGGGLRIEHAAAGDDDRPLSGLEGGDRRGELVFVGTYAARRPDLFGEQDFRPIERLGLNVLAHGERHRAAFGRIGEHVHGALQRGDQLLRATDAVEIARHRAEAVVGRHGAVGEVLDLLQHRVGQAVGEDVARQEQERQPVDVGDGGGSDHVERAGADGRRAGHEAAAEARLSEGDGDSAMACSLWAR